jgi:hypothetical protein|nr:MAG TPA: Protein of unknown function (DUF2612) [Caudoviricetes sp.]
MYHNQGDLYYKAWRRLPERFRKPNNLDLYYVLYGGYGELEKGFASINDSRNIDKAQGETLDKLGANVGQFRFGEDDDLYRLLIRIRIIANLSIGDIPTINKIMSILVKDIFLGIKETWSYEKHRNEPAAIVLQLSEIWSNIPLEIINRIKAAGVRVILETYLHQTIYYGMYGQKAKHYKVLPNKVEDKEFENQVFMGMATYHKKIKRVAIMPEVWTLNQNDMFLEVEDGSGVRMKYD